MIFVHFCNSGPDKFLMVEDEDAPPGTGPALNARINAGQDVSTGRLTTDGNGYASRRWTTREAASGREDGGQQGGLQQGDQITI